MNIDDQTLCDYIFGLLDEREAQLIEENLKNSDDLTKRLNELNSIFCGLDTLKDEFPSPLSKLMAGIYKVSCAGATIASVMTLFWATMFGHVSKDFMKNSTSVDSSHSYECPIRCTSGLDHEKPSFFTFNNIANLRE